ncbi:MAG: hypothetical protein Kow0037_31640 [Calditrichia bacterium]
MPKYLTLPKLMFFQKMANNYILMGECAYSGDDLKNENKKAIDNTAAVAVAFCGFIFFRLPGSEGAHGSRF